jgi:signal transduction histidine kinase
VAERFYEVLMSNPSARQMLSDAAQVERLKQTLRHWLVELMGGPWDEHWYARRRRIGQVHVRVGLPERYVYLAMNTVREELLRLAIELGGPRGPHMARDVMAICDLELAIMSSTYLEAHEEQRLQSLQELILAHLPFLVLCLDGQGRPYRSAAGGLLQELPAPLRQAIDLQALIAQAHEEDRDMVLPRVGAVGEGGAQHWRISVLPLGHELAHTMVLVEDVSDVVRAEVRLQQAESLARIGTMAANIAHEVRNPLTAISSTLQVIRQSMVEGDRRRAILGKVEEQIQRLDGIVGDLLGYSRPAAARPVVVDLRAVARDAVAAAPRPVRVRIQEPAPVRADPGHMVQIALNLLQNACDAAGPGGEVVLQLGPGPVLEVQDDGPGVHRDVAASLFDPFVTTKIRGTGLGLAICRKLAGASDGELSWAPRWPDQVRQGAIFRLTLPRAPGGSEAG